MNELQMMRTGHRNRLGQLATRNLNLFGIGHLGEAVFGLALSALIAAGGSGCSSKPKPAQLSGTVTFKGQPVPAGYISFTPDTAGGNIGQLKVFQINEGAFDSAKETPPGLPPGAYFVRIAGFDGKKIPMYGQGKQIFNEVTDLKYTVPDGVSTKDFVIPDAAGQNVLIRPTADT